MVLCTQVTQDGFVTSQQCLNSRYRFLLMAISASCTLDLESLASDCRYQHHVVNIHPFPYSLAHPLRWKCPPHVHPPREPILTAAATDGKYRSLCAFLLLSAVQDVLLGFNKCYWEASRMMDSYYANEKGNGTW